MTSDSRSTDRNELSSMTHEFLAKGGKIVQCPPGSSENVVYKRTSYRRRGAPTDGKPATDGTAVAPAADSAPVATAPKEE